MTRDIPRMIRIAIVLLSALVIAVGCVGGIWVLRGVGPFLSATEPAYRSILPTELICTDTYKRKQQDVTHNWLTAALSSVHVPFVNPRRMVTSMFLPIHHVSQNAIPVPKPLGLARSPLPPPIAHFTEVHRKLSIGWIPTADAHSAIAMIQQNPGLSVISPEWMTVENASGFVQNQVQPSVVTYAHRHNIQVWAMITNQFDAGLTHAVLANAGTERVLVNQITEIARQSQLDGVNVDFENVHAADRDAFTKFVGDLHSDLSPFHIKLSVDISPDIVFLRDTDAFFHAGLAASCDYLILMAYDEHWASDQEPGPVADLPWVRIAVNDLLNTGVPSDKLILGLPLYARFWYVHTDGSVTSLSTATSAVPGILAQHGASVTWNDTLGVAYAKYPKPEGYMEVWYETSETLNRKLALVRDDGLAGIAVWSLGLSDHHSWSTIIQALRRALS